jgi:uncharacterized membrane protein YkvA (DUF1232 family)
MKNLLKLYYALKDHRSPWYAKLTALLSIVYLLSPADLIPDIVPLAGYLDDLVIVPFLMSISSRLLPAEVKIVAEQQAIKNHRKMKWVMALIILVIIALMVLFFYLAAKFFIYLKDMF